MIMIRIGILGMGIRGEMYAQGIAQNSDATLVGISDINRSTLETSEQKLGVPGYLEFTDLLDKRKPDAVIICTPDYAHHTPAITAAKRKIHILIEKPLANSQAEAAQIVDAVRSNNIICQIAFENRWNPPFVQLKNAVDSKELGDITLVSAKLNDTIWVPTQMISWANKTTVGWFLLPHVLDLAMWLSGKIPNKVYAVANKGVLTTLGIDTYDTICTIISFKDGMQAAIENSWVLPESTPAVYDFRFSILGEKGSMQVNSQDQMVHKFTDKFTYPGSLYLDIYGQARGFPLYMLDSFVACVLEGKEPIATVEEGYLVTKAVEAVHHSIESGNPIWL
jgi:predicted dehydrogenase